MVRLNTRWVVGHGLVTEALKLVAQCIHQAVEELLLVVQRLQGCTVLRIQPEAIFVLNLFAMASISFAGNLLHGLSQICQSLAHLEDLSLNVGRCLSLSLGSSALGWLRSIDEGLQVRGRLLLWRCLLLLQHRLPRALGT